MVVLLHRQWGKAGETSQRRREGDLFKYIPIQPRLAEGRGSDCHKAPFWGVCGAQRGNSSSSSSYTSSLGILGSRIGPFAAGHVCARGGLMPSALPGAWSIACQLHVNFLLPGRWGPLLPGSQVPPVFPHRLDLGMFDFLPSHFTLLQGRRGPGGAQSSSDGGWDWKEQGFRLN